LLRRAVRKTLTPDLKASTCVRGEVHPPTIRGPCGVRALSSVGPNDPAPGTPVLGNEPARNHSRVVHFGHQNVLPVWGKI
jgi:hypothetical protein